MTLEEAKKILENEGFHMFLAKEAVNQIGAIREFEKPKVSEAIKVANANKLMVCLSPMEWDERKARLKKEYEKNTKAPGPGEEQPKENVLKAATDAFILQANEIMRLKNKNAELLEAIDKMKEGNPALEESASQFNDALLDEQAKKIAELTKENEDLKSWHEMRNRGIALSNIAFRDEKKRLGKEISKLNGIIHDKNAILSDVAEELRLSKIREKNLTEVGQKYMKENEELKKELADNVVDKINANALKSAESALAYKEKVIAEKNEVIVDLGRKLNTQKDLADDISLEYDGAKYNLKLRMDECEKLKKELEKMTKLVETVRNASKEYCDYGVAANEFIKKLANLYVIAGNNGTISNEMLERCKNYQTYGFPANCNRETKKEIDDIARGNKNKKPRIPTPEEPKYDSIIERCKRLGIELHYHDGKVPTYTNAFGDEVPVYGLRGIFAICTDEEYKSLFKK